MVLSRSLQFTSLATHTVIVASVVKVCYFGPALALVTSLFRQGVLHHFLEHDEMWMRIKGE